MFLVTWIYDATLRQDPVADVRQFAYEKFQNRMRMTVDQIIQSGIAEGVYDEIPSFVTDASVRDRFRIDEIPTSRAAEAREAIAKRNKQIGIE